MFKNLVRLKLKMDALNQTDAYHRYLAILLPCLDKRKDVPNIVCVHLQIYNALNFVHAEQLAKMHK